MRPLRQSVRHAKAFTLVELLAVVGIMMTVGAFTAMGTRGLFRGASLNGAGAELDSVAETARVNSVSKGLYTALVIPTTTSGAMQSYCLMELPRNDDGSFGTWRAVTAWKFLPSGIVFDNNAVSSFLSVASVAPVPLPSSVKIAGQAIDLSANGRFQVYQPNGTLLSGQSVRLSLTQGYFNLATQTVVATVAGGDHYDLVFVRDTGRIRVERP